MILASTATDAAALISAITGLVVAIVTLLTLTRVNRVHQEIKTTNGLTIAMLADRAEGRRIESDVAADDRTAAEQHYVTDLRKPDAHGEPYGGEQK